MEDESSIIYRILQDQIQKSMKFDWINLVNQDLVELEISLNYEQIKQMMKNEFKILVKDKAEAAAFKYLMNEKQKLSKMSNLSYTKLELGKHLRANMNLTRTEVNSMMNFRSRMTNLKCNYKSAYRADQLFCRLCLDKNTEESQSHLMRCELLNENSVRCTESLIYEDLFCIDPKMVCDTSKILSKLYSLFRRKLQETIPSAREPSSGNSVADVTGS